jgi:hypothetical protein
MGRVIYALLALFALGFWVYANSSAYSAGAPAYSLPPSVRHSPGGYRSFHFWHSGFHMGK